MSNTETEQLSIQAKANIRKWGIQNFETLGLAIAEETGELAQAILQYKYENKPEECIAKEAIDLGALCLQILWRYDVTEEFPVSSSTMYQT